jgi:endonuclease III
MLTLPEALDHLADLYGEPVIPAPRPVFELVLRENVAYLVDDETRSRSLELLRAEVGLTPDAILFASDASLTSATGHGILAEHQADKLRAIARITRDTFGGDLETLKEQPLPQARRALRKFPSIGEPGAEKILLFAHAYPVLGLDSNGVRVLTRLGLVVEARGYSATYRGVQRLGAEFASHGVEWLIRAHLLLRQHGQELCKRTRPMCDRCPLNLACAFYHAATRQPMKTELKAPTIGTVRRDK